MKTTRILIPVLTLAAAALLMAQATPGSTPAPKGNTPAPAPPEAFPAPGDPLPPAPAAPAPAPQAPAAVPPAPTPAAPATPAIIPNPPPNTPSVVPQVAIGQIVPVPARGQFIVPNPLAPAPAAAANPLNEPRAAPFIGAGTINGTRVSARGRATIFSSLVFQFNKHEPVNILEEIILKKPKAGEPRKWFRVQMPQDTGVWVHSQFLGEPFTRNVLNAQGQPVPLKYAQVTANRLNIRGGAGENHPVIGRLLKGATVRISAQKKGKWVELFAPANASVYVAAQFVTRVPLNQGVVEVPGPGQGVVTPPVNPVVPPVLVNPPVPVNPIGPIAVGPAPVGPTTPPAPVGPTTPPAPIGPTPPPIPPVETIVTLPAKAFGQPNGVTENGVPIKQASTPKGVNPTTPNIVAVKPTQPVEPPKVAKVIETNPNLPPASTQKPGATEPPIRIVTREGIVRRTRAPQAPSGYILEHLESGKKINYLLLNHATLKLNWFIGQRVLVSGQEAIDARQANTPVLKVKTLKGDVSPKAIKELTLAQARKKDPEEAGNSTPPEVAPKPEGTTPKVPAAPEVPKPESTTPKVPAPEAPKPESTTPKAPAPEAPKPEGTAPKVPAPEAPKPEGTAPKAPAPEDNKPELTKPEAPTPETLNLRELAKLYVSGKIEASEYFRRRQLILGTPKPEQPKKSDDQ